MPDRRPMEYITNVRIPEESNVKTVPGLAISVIVKYPYEYGMILVGVLVTRMNARANVRQAGITIPIIGRL